MVSSMATTSFAGVPGTEAMPTEGRAVKEDRLIGPPGTGKTTFLSEVLAYHARRVGSDAVVAISHTKAAAAELAGRKTPLPQDNIATLHALAYRALDRPPLAEDTEHLREFSDEHPDWRMSSSMDPEELEFHTGGAPGDFAMAEYARLRNLERDRSFWPVEALAFARDWERYKAETETIDFTDMISLAIEETSCAPQDPAVIVLDEAQDTSRLQWRLLQRWTASPNCETWITAGDPDQSIYEWAGADPTWFLENPPAREKVLEQSYRVPRAVHKLAADWIRQNSDRKDVAYLPRDYPGTVSHVPADYKYPMPVLDTIERCLDAGKSVMVMATCSYMLKDLVSTLRKEAIPFANPWRRKRGDWNPLHRKRGASTAGAVRAFLAPHADGRIWTGDEVLAWMPIVKDVFARGGREELAQRIKTAKEDDPEQVAADLISLLKDETDYSEMLSTPPACVDWLERHLLAEKRKPAEFPLEIVRRRGAAALDEEPRLFVGTCHSFKGAEADVVIVFPDLSYQGYERWAAGERSEIVRLFYVAFTRAREELILCSAASGAAVW